MLNIAEITNVMRAKLPVPLDKAVSTSAPLFSTDGRPLEYAGLPTIKRVPPSSPHGPYGMVNVQGNPSGGAYNPGGALNAPGSDFHVPHQQAYGTYQGALSMNVFEQQQLSTGENQVANWMTEQVEGVASSIARAMSPDCLIGNAANLIDGLFSRAVQALNVYGGINRALFPNYACISYNAAGIPRNISVPILEAAWNNYTSTAVPDYQPGNWVGITDSIQMTALEGLAAGNIATWNTDSPVKILGAQGVSVKGRRVYELAGAPLGSIIFINFDALQWEFLNGQPFTIQDPQVIGDRTIWNVYLHGQLRLRNPRKNAFRVDDLV